MSTIGTPLRWGTGARVLRLVTIHLIRGLLTADLTMTAFAVAGQLLHRGPAWPLDPGPGVLLLAVAGAQWLRRPASRPGPRGGVR